jgi:hypothetical protein
MMAQTQQYVLQEAPVAGKMEQGHRAAIILKDPGASLEGSAIVYERQPRHKGCPTMWQVFAEWVRAQQPIPTCHCSLQYRLPDANSCTNGKVEMVAPDVMCRFLREICSMSHTQLMGASQKQRPDARTMLVFVAAAWSHDVKEKNELLAGKVPSTIVAEHQRLLEQTEQMKSLLELLENTNAQLQSQHEDFLRDVANERSLNATLICRKDAEIAMLKEENSRLQMACNVDATGRLPDAAMMTPTSPLSLRSEPMSPHQNVDMESRLSLEEVASLFCEESDVDWHNELQFAMEVHPDNVVIMH